MSARGPWSRWTVPGGAAIVVAVGALGVWACSPWPRIERVGSNEASAQSSLKAIATGQEQFKAACLLDQDRDAEGEYGLLQELAGFQTARGIKADLRQRPYIPSVLGKTQGRGYSMKSGYCFALLLSRSGREAVSDDALGAGLADPASADLQEKAYFVLAWPQVPGRSGIRLFFEAGGKIYARRFLDGWPPPEPLRSLAPVRHVVSGGLEVDQARLAAEGWTETG